MKKKGIVAVFVLIVLTLLIGGINWLRNTNSSKAQEINSLKKTDMSKLDDLIVTPQNPTDKVIVKSAKLDKNGFLVVRQMDDGKLSQVIEMSKPLKIGAHKDITINLGNADIKNKELIVMIYEDYSSDQIFNDFDMPALNENGNMTARYVKTGKPLPTNITEGDSAGMAHNMPGMKTMAKIIYSDKGFAPDTVNVPVGSTVEFVNQSNMDMWVASMSHPSHTILPTFDQFRGYKKGAIYRYVFDKKGTWEYHDHISPSFGGKIVVN
jgi:plastocyanin